MSTPSLPVNGSKYQYNDIGTFQKAWSRETGDQEKIVHIRLPQANLN